MAAIRYHEPLKEIDNSVKQKQKVMQVGQIYLGRSPLRSRLPTHLQLPQRLYWSPGNQLCFCCLPSLSVGEKKHMHTKNKNDKYTFNSLYNMHLNSSFSCLKTRNNPDNHPPLVMLGVAAGTAYFPQVAKASKFGTGQTDKLRNQKFGVHFVY